MKVWGEWYGGSSYSVPETGRDTEEFESLKEAKSVFESRYSNWGGNTPVVDEQSEMWIFFVDPRTVDSPYPDRIIEFGPRGGVIVEYA